MAGDGELERIINRPPPAVENQALTLLHGHPPIALTVAVVFVVMMAMWAGGTGGR